MSAIVFLGPSLPRREAERLLPGAAFRAPAILGDVYDAAEAGTHDCIVLLDGNFESTPAVWHKEILFAVSRGITVVGASSMGALRAAELHPFGMHGVGRVFEGYRDGVLEDDDEVALLHGPEQSGYAGLSVPMVNLRFGVATAIRERLLGAARGQRLLDAVKAQHYTARTWTLIRRELAAAQATDADDMVDLLRQRRCDLKAADASAALECVARGGLPAAPARVPFETTDFWEQFVAARGQRGVRRPRVREIMVGMEQLRSAPPDTVHEAWITVLERELERWLPIAVERATIDAAWRGLRAENGLRTTDDIGRWMGERGLDHGALERWVRERALHGLLLRRLHERHRAAVIEAAMRRARLQGLEADAERCLTDTGQVAWDGAKLDRAHADALWRFFEERFARGAGGTITDHAARLGFGSAAELLDAIRAAHRVSLAACEENPNSRSIH